MESVRIQRDGAIATLQKHGISCDNHMTGYVSDLQTLKTQNEELRDVIKQMRVELEQLSDMSSQKDGMPTANYVRYMEEEVRQVKSENRQLVEQLQQTGLHRKPPTPTTNVKRKSLSPARGGKKHNRSISPSEESHTVHHHRHLIALSDTISSLQKEKVELENRGKEWKIETEQLQERLKEEAELVHIFCAYVAFNLL